MARRVLKLLVALCVCMAAAMQCHNPLACLGGKNRGYNTATDCILGASELEQISFQRDLILREEKNLQNNNKNNEKPSQRHKLRRKLKGSKRQKKREKRKSRRKRSHRCT